MKSGDIKKIIVDFCSQNRTHLDAQMTRPLTDEEFNWTLDKDNWKRISKDVVKLDWYIPMGIYPGDIERDFDCKPFDDQLRSTVIERNGEIIRLTVQGE